MKIEAIPGFVAPVYSLIARKNTCIKDIHKEVAEEISSKISSGRVLDIGTGPGYVPFEIAKRAPGLEITGIDLSPGMIDIANKNAKDSGLSDRVKFQVANAESLPFEEGHFDIVISTLSLHHWLHPALCFKEICRVLRKNGEAYIYDIRRDTTQEVNAQVRERYGWFLSFMLLTVVRSHSSMTLKAGEEILSSMGPCFSSKNVHGEGVILKFSLLK